MAPRGERLLAAWERPSGMMFLGRELHQDVSLHRHLRGAAAAPLTRAWSSWTAAAFRGVAGACFPEQGLSGALKKLVNPLQNTSSNTSPGAASPEVVFRLLSWSAVAYAQLVLQHQLPRGAQHRLPSRVVAVWVSL